MEEKFELSLILGRFNHIHNGHKMLIDFSRKISKKTLILIGSSQLSGTKRNPFTYELRESLIKKLYGNCDDVIVAGLKDMTNENDICYEWGRYLLENTEKIAGRKPDVMIYGKDESRKGWFDENDVKDIAEIIMPRSRLKISATELRGLLIDDNFEKWKEFTPKEIHEDYDILRKELLKIY